MALEPVCLLSYRVDPAGVLALVQRMAPHAFVDHDGATWRAIEVRSAAADGHGPLVLRHDPDAYANGRWPAELAGVRARVKGFPPTVRTAEIVRALSGVRFRLDTGPGCVVDLERPDERAAIVLAVADQLDAFILTPSALRDPQGRVLVGDLPPQLGATLPSGSTTMPGSELLASTPPPAPDRDPSPARVAVRALALAAVSSRAFLEQMDATKVDVEYERAKLLGWVNLIDLTDELDPDEWQLLQSPVGSVEDKVAVDAAWRLEGLTVLAWALDRIELPPYDRMVSPARLFPALGFLDPDARLDLGHHARLVSDDEIERLRRQLFTIRWRLREYKLLARSMDLTTTPTVTRAGVLDFSGCRLIDHDLAIGRLPIDIAPTEQVRQVENIVAERLHGLCWLQQGGTYAHIALDR